MLDPKNGDVLAEIEPILVPSRNVIFLETLVSVRQPESKVSVMFGSRYTLSLDFTNESEGTEESSAEDSKAENQKPEKEPAPNVE